MFSNKSDDSQTFVTKTVKGGHVDLATSCGIANQVRFPPTINSPYRWNVSKTGHFFRLCCKVNSIKINLWNGFVNNSHGLLNLSV